MTSQPTVRWLAVIAMCLMVACASPENDTPETTLDAPPAAGDAMENAPVLAGEAACPSLVGSWMLEAIDESAAALSGGFASDPNYQVAPTLKILNDTHWMFIRQSADEFIFSQGGRYVLEDGRYTETVEYSAIPQNVGLSFSFDCVLEGDSLWHHVGGIGDARYDEMWKRVR